MPTAAWLEVRLAMIGALRLARGDRGGLSCFDRSLDGFWRSFRAAVISYPLYLGSTVDARDRRRMGEVRGRS